MPLIGPVPQGTFFCPHCGALYSVTHARRPKERQQNCKMPGLRKPWTSGIEPKVPIYKLIHRPEDA